MTKAGYALFTALLISACSSSTQVTFSVTDFIESEANDGSIAAPLSFTVKGERFAVPVGTVLTQRNYQLSGDSLPPGLTALVTVTGSQSGTVTLQGKAIANEAIQSVENLIFEIFTTRTPLRILFSAGGSTLAQTKYTVGGTISGLSGSLTLQNNGGDDFTATTNQPFTFATTLAHQSPYAVTITAQPINQTCSVSNGTGTITGASVNNVSVSCSTFKLWTSPSGLTDNLSPDGQNATGADVAMDDNGNAMIVWQQSDGTHNQIFKAEYRSGSWTLPSSLSDNISPDGQNAANPQVAMDNAGNAIIVWEQNNGTTSKIYKAEYRAGAWALPSGLGDSISPGNSATLPQVVLNNSGRALIVWQASDGSLLQIFRSEYVGGVWTHPASAAANISPNGTNATTPSCALDDSNNGVIAWSQSNGTWTRIFRSTLDGNIWIDPVSLSEGFSPVDVGTLNANAIDPQVVMDNNLRFTIAWIQSDGNNQQVFVSRAINLTWTDPANQTDNLSPDGEDATQARIAINQIGNLLVVWQQSDGSNQQVFYSELVNGVWLNPASLSDNLSVDGQDALAPAVALDDLGNYLVTWHQSDGGQTQIYKAEYRAGSWTVPSSLTDRLSPVGSNALNSSAAMDASGQAIATWIQNDGANDQAFKAEYR